ncbi:MAG: biotin--[acetyl-CoA-carboxylase] ligase, partial [Porticoccaceae bacterium]|nr:biotin--[acetyl-CoA-carboxylase] ligase [Porticoccaceae bacterium]
MVADSTGKLIGVLADGGFHSGEELGAQLGVSRTAVWKQVQKLVELGLDVEKVRGRGYCVPGGVELLDSEMILSSLAEPARGQLRGLDILSSTGSTNSVARSRAEAGDASGYVVLAEQQTAGRGRRGRQWVSPYARNLYLSTVWGFDGGAAALEGLSLAVGVAVKRALAACGVSDSELKWPNDVLCNGDKVAGILLEMIGDPAGFCQVVVGIGVNVDMPDSKGAAIDQRWTDMGRVIGGHVSRNRVAACLLDELLPLLASYQRLGFASYREEWQGS